MKPLVHSLGFRHPLAGTLAVLISCLVATVAPAFAGETAVSTCATLLVGFPSGEDEAEGVLVVPGTVIPNIGRSLPDLTSEEERSRALARLTRELSSVFRLEKIEAKFTDLLRVELKEPVELSPPAPDSSLRITVELLGFDAGTATYQVRFVDRNVVLADTRLAAVRGRQAVIGGLDGEQAPYLFLVLEPAAPPSPEQSSSPPFRVADGITAPRRLSSVSPRYTEEAKKERIQGVVILQTVIEKDGTVSDVQVLKGLPFGLSEAAAEAIRQWTFEPARDASGRPVSVYFNLTVNFKLDDSPKDGEEPAEPPPPEADPAPVNTV